MSTTTSSEERVNDDESPHRGSETAEEKEQPLTPKPEIDEPERKRRRTATEKARELRMQSYAKARMREMDSAKSQGSDSHHRTPSADPSMTRSDDGSRSSPGHQTFRPMRVAMPRVGKRLRRKPQRWEGERQGERPHRLPRITRRDELLHDDESTASIHSATSIGLPPVVDNPFEDLRAAVVQCGSQPSRREIVDSFHSWQLRTVSKQAAQQKALHIFLKRRLRKRNTRSPEYERMEDEALRNARTIVARTRKENGQDDADQETTVEDDVNMSSIVPDKLRPPLEAYLPRRVRPHGKVVNPYEIFEMLLDAPHYPGSKVKVDESGEQKWMTLPTVAASAEWNTRKSRRAPNSKTDTPTMTTPNDG